MYPTIEIKSLIAGHIAQYGTTEISNIALQLIQQKEEMEITIKSLQSNISELDNLNTQHGQTIVRLNETIQNQDKTIQDQIVYIDKLRAQLKVAEKITTDFIAGALLNNKDFMANMIEHITECLTDDITDNVIKEIENNATFETTISLR